jgi:carbon storage regulator
VLILSRRVGEAVIIGADVTVVILDIKGRQVRVGVKAPNSIDIFRDEIFPGVRGRKKLAENTAGPATDP